MSCSCVKQDGSVPGNVQAPDRPGLPVRWCVTLLRGYKRFISPLFPPSCRFTPTCSEYAIDAVRSRGLVRGLFLAVLRLLRCHPFARGGYDPVD
ncbi:MAG: membrane protein insertion efficiency factor YidD [Desulfobulbaceae bacterium]|nr:membrane protein insertion efficiency factor YidD [Desulfobulbaceae bacterium]